MGEPVLVNPSLTAPPALARCVCLLHGEPGEAHAPASHKTNWVSVSGAGPLTLTRLIFCSVHRTRANQISGLSRDHPMGCSIREKSNLQSPCARNTTPSAQQNPIQRTASNTFSNRESQPCLDEILPFHIRHLLRKGKLGTDLLTPTSTLFVITGARWKATGLAVCHCQTRTQQ